MRPRKPRQSWLRFTTGQLMGLVVISALVITAVAPLERSSPLGWVQAAIRVLIVLPLALALTVALASRRNNRRRVIVDWMTSFPMLYLAFTYFVGALLAYVVDGVSAPGRFQSAANEMGTTLGIVFQGAIPFVYFGLLWRMMPDRCPHCRARAIEPAGTSGAGVLSGREESRCGDCGAQCVRGPDRAWRVEALPTHDDLGWYGEFAPKLSSLRRELRPELRQVASQHSISPDQPLE